METSVRFGKGIVPLADFVSLALAKSFESWMVMTDIFGESSEVGSEGMAGEARDASGGASSSGRVRRRESLPRAPPHTGDWSPLALPLVM